MPLVTPAQVSQLLPGLLSEDEGAVDVLIESADAYLASWLGWPVPDAGGAPTLEEATYTEYRDGHDLYVPTRITLRVPAVVSVTSLYVDPTGEYVGDEEPVESVNRTLRGNTIRVLDTSAVRLPKEAREGIRAVYVAGFDVDAPPRHVVDALIHCVRELWRLRAVSGLPNAADVAPPPESIVTPAIRTLLGRYRIVAEAP